LAKSRLNPLTAFWRQFSLEFTAIFDADVSSSSYCGSFFFFKVIFLHGPSINARLVFRFVTLIPRSARIFSSFFMFFPSHAANISSPGHLLPVVGQRSFLSPRAWGVFLIASTLNRLRHPFPFPFPDRSLLFFPPTDVRDRRALSLLSKRRRILPHFTLVFRLRLHPFLKSRSGLSPQSDFLLFLPQMSISSLAACQIALPPRPTRKPVFFVCPSDT